ncbi:hypothetical protein HK101_005996 [Irineochytrium annulatum]|nr:hypothetical protein HK101_005996 [Irineochytrium annulatum]
MDVQQHKGEYELVSVKRSLLQEGQALPTPDASGKVIVPFEIDFMTPRTRFLFPLSFKSKHGEICYYLRAVLNWVPFLPETAVCQSPIDVFAPWADAPPPAEESISMTDRSAEGGTAPGDALGELIVLWLILTTVKGLHASNPNFVLRPRALDNLLPAQKSDFNESYSFANPSSSNLRPSVEVGATSTTPVPSYPSSAEGDQEAADELSDLDGETLVRPSAAARGVPQAAVTWSAVNITITAPTLPSGRRNTSELLHSPELDAMDSFEMSDHEPPFQLEEDMEMDEPAVSDGARRSLEGVEPMGEGDRDTDVALQGRPRPQRRRSCRSEAELAHFAGEASVPETLLSIGEIELSTSIPADSFFRTERRLPEPRPVAAEVAGETTDHLAAGEEEPPPPALEIEGDVEQASAPEQVVAADARGGRMEMRAKSTARERSRSRKRTAITIGSLWFRRMPMEGGDSAINPDVGTSTSVDILRDAKLTDDGDSELGKAKAKGGLMKLFTGRGQRKSFSNGDQMQSPAASSVQSPHLRSRGVSDADQPAAAVAAATPTEQLVTTPTTHPVRIASEPLSATFAHAPLSLEITTAHSLPSPPPSPPSEVNPSPQNPLKSIPRFRILMPRTILGPANTVPIHVHLASLPANRKIVSLTLSLTAAVTWEVDGAQTTERKVLAEVAMEPERSDQLWKKTVHLSVPTKEEMGGYGFPFQSPMATLLHYVSAKLVLSKKNVLGLTTKESFVLGKISIIMVRQ